MRKRLGGSIAALALLALLGFAIFAYGREPATATAFALPAVPFVEAPPTDTDGSKAAGDGEPFVLSNSNGVSRWATVAEPVQVRAEPDAEARVVARLKTVTPEGTTNAVLALQRVSRGGKLWVQVRLPILPNNTLGWVPRSSLGGYNVVTTHLVIDTKRLSATLYRRGRAVFRSPVGIGQRRWPTPTGRFYIRNKLTKYKNAFYGPLAFGTSARTAVLTDWPAGGFIGIHGTNAPNLIPGRVSHGCVRLRNPDILRLATLMSVGTPITIR